MPARQRRPTLITGTDTGVGKTLIASGIAAALGSRGQRVGVYKPVETGCRRIGDRLVGDDAEKLLAAAGAGQQAHTVSSYLFELPAAPLIAAEAAGQCVDPDHLVRDLTELAHSFDILIVEGAGGLMVPIAESYTYLDFAKQLGLAVIVVVGSRLGCINHALLTLRTLDAAGVVVHGFVVNALTAENANGSTVADNRRTIARFTDSKDLGSFPFVPDDEQADTSKLASLAEKYLDLTSLV